MPIEQVINKHRQGSFSLRLPHFSVRRQSIFLVKSSRVKYVNSLLMARTG